MVWNGRKTGKRQTHTHTRTIADHHNTRSDVRKARIGTVTFSLMVTNIYNFSLVILITVSGRGIVHYGSSSFT